MDLAAVPTDRQLGRAHRRDGCCSWSHALSPFEGLNSAINDVNVFRRFSEWLIGKTEDLFREYGYYVVFFGVLAENSMFLGLFVPGAIILILGGLSR